MPLPTICRPAIVWVDTSDTATITYGGHAAVTVPAGGSAQVTLPWPSAFGEPSGYRVTGPLTSVQVWMLVTVDGVTNAPSNFGTYPAISGGPTVVQSPIVAHDDGSLVITYLNPGVVEANYRLVPNYPAMLATVRQATVGEICTSADDALGIGIHCRLWRRRGPVTNAMPAGEVGDRVHITYADYGWDAYPFLVTRVTLERRGKHHVKILDLDTLPGANPVTGGNLYLTFDDPDAGFDEGVFAA